MAKTAVLSQSRISLDTWSVILALVAVVLIRTGILKAIPW